ncbi:hypothetical protein AB832_03140 [Flavobacteriaceae bacterium (ex Bugula neritina AB1)]|nr:hypothetical protein AB832_03140 [Flavobacteriaceae bacterium (ex Bugula neritina AB1)]
MVFKKKIMKHIIKISKVTSILFAFLVIHSCQDAIDIEQPGRLLEENTFETINDLELGLLGVYSLLDNSIEIRFNSMFTDEGAQGASSSGPIQDGLMAI